MLEIPRLDLQKIVKKFHIYKAKKCYKYLIKINSKLIFFGNFNNMIKNNKQK